MAYNTKYKIEFTSLLDNEVRIELQQDGFSGTITNVTGTGASLVRADGDRDKMVGVRSSSLEFSIICNDTLTPDLFFTESDTQTKVLLYFNDVLNWAGWLDSSAFEFPFFDANIEFKLTARDGLHLLSKAKFTEFSSVNPWGVYSIVDVIGYCLNITNLFLDYWTWIDVYPNDYPIRGASGDTLGDNDPLNNVYIDIGTFRTGSDEYDSPMTILEKVCESFKMVLFQAKGQWHVVYIEDWIRNLGLTGTRWSTSIFAQEYVENEFNEFDIGLSRNYKLINANANCSLQSAKKSARINYAFDIPPSKVRNQDFNTGESLGIDPLDSQYERFNLEGWYYTGQRPYAYGYVLDNNAVIESPKRWIQFVDDGSNNFTELISDSIIASASDDFTVSFKYGMRDLVHNWTSKMYFDIKLVDNLGTIYLKADGTWSSTRQMMPMPLLKVNGNTSTYYTHKNPNEITISSTVSLRAGGNLFIMFRSEDPLGGESVAPTNSLFGSIFDLEFTYKGKLAVSRRDSNLYGYFRTLPSGMYFESKKDKVTKSDFNNETYITHSPNIATKGALFSSSVTYLKNWNHRGVSEMISLGKLITRAIWKLGYRTFYRMEATSLNISINDYLISNLHIAKIDELPNKKFMIATITTDLYNEKAELTMVELLNDATTNDFDEVATIEKNKYISDFGERIFPAPRRTSRDPVSFSGGIFGFLFSLLSKRQ